MNTTLYWRTGANNLLSKEFFQLAKSHLKPDGVLYFNTTGCDDIIYTAAHIFKYATMLGNLVAVSDSPFNLSKNQKKYNLSQFFNESNRPLVDFNDPLAKPLIEILINLPLLDLSERYLNSTKHHWLITKDNLANEFKYDQHFYNPNR